MGWRQRFDPARVRIDELRERTKGLRDIRTLGAQVAHVRRVGLRGEVLVPIIAVLILAVALGLSALAPDSPGEIVLVDDTATSIAEAPAITDTVAAPTGTAEAGYPSPSVVPTLATPDPAAMIGSTDGITDTAGITATDTIAEAQPPDEGYPIEGSQPQGVGQPPSGGVPSTETDPLAPPPVGNPPTSAGGVSPDQLVAPTPPQAASGGYPAPLVQQPVPTVRVPQPAIPRPNNPAPPVSPPQGEAPADDASYPGPDDAGTTGSDDAGTAGSDDTGTTDPDQEQTPVPTSETQNETPAAPAVVTPTATPLPPTPTPRPAQVLSGTVHWTAANSPITVSEDQLVAQGAVLMIDPGVEVRFAPDVRLTIAGTLRAGGNAATPVRMVGPNGRWDGLVGTVGSAIALDGVALSQAGRNGTALSSSGGTLVVRNSTLTDSGGGIVSLGSVIDLRGTQITGNSIPGPAVHVVLPKQDGSIIAGNIIGGNTTPHGAPQLLLAGEDAPGVFALEGNQIVGDGGPGLVVNSPAPLRGTIRCNSFERGTIGLQLNTQRRDLGGFELAIDTNSFVGQARFGAAGTLAFNVANNWWGDPSGPLEAQRNPQGRGVAIGVNLQFQPWLAARPGCAPQ